MDISVISFNIRHCDDKNGHSVLERIPRIFSILKEENADVIGLQEVRPHWEDALKENLLNDYDMFLKYRAEAPDIEASPIFWKKDKFTLIKSGYFWYSDTPNVQSKGWDEVYDCHRMCCFVLLKEKVSNKEFLFINTHFGFGDNCQVKSADLIKKYSNDFENLPIFITGDFNMTTDTLGYAQMTKHFTDVNKVTANYNGITYHGYDESNEECRLIDYCFINENVKGKSYKVLNKTFDGKYPSDHFGLKIELDI